MELILLKDNNRKIGTEITVKDTKVGIMRIGNIDYVSLTDIAKYQNPKEPAIVIVNWMSNLDSFNFYSLWEKLNNPEFNFMEFHKIKLSTKRFMMTPKQWKDTFNAIGIKPSAGKYSIGTFAHPDIAFEFATWIDTSFKLYLIKEFERLKVNESYQNKIEWSVKRELSKTNYIIHTDSIKEYIVPILTESQKQYVYASEADVLNVALFGMTAKEWRDKNPNSIGNIRDYTDILHLVVLVNLENLNAELIANGISQRERLEKLNNTAKKQLEILKDNSGIKRLENMDNNISNQKLLNAVQETEDILSGKIKAKKYNSTEELFADWAEEDLEDNVDD
jgi:hypothetical protein